MSTILKLHNMLVKREISAKELTMAFLDAIERDDPKLNTYVTLCPELALEQAEKADKLFGAKKDTGLLQGIPFSLKDNISTKGILTTCCSKMLKSYTPVYDATVWERLKAHGAVLLGKANMDEFAMGTSGETSCFGATKNPVNTNYSPGGSSSGSAAAVCANLAPFSIGSDTGGSVRQPAAFCGMVGLKPTYGAVSRYGLIAYASSFDQIGIVTSAVEDAAIVFDAIKGADPKDSTSKEHKGSVYSVLGENVKGRVIGVIKELYNSADDEIKSAVDKSVKVFESLGVRVEFFSLPEIENILSVYYILASAEASSNLGRYDGIRYGAKAEHYENIHDMVCKTRSENFGKEVKNRIMLGTFVLSQGFYEQYYQKAYSLRNVITRAYEKAFTKYDAILSPTTPATAFELGKASKDKVDSYRSDICTVGANIAGLPAVSVPCGMDKKGLPIGVQLMGKPFDEEGILNLAYSFMKSRGECIKTDWGVKYGI